ncbi:hypothetical protein CC85DRAFT_288161 [Cutaneotrichosporon oleaginosum]|uniref:Uncharacterized protein n=1 Tax=Cutaneotrichosporon oleaginosum TaxID=879819 RepID=A0A0J0XFF0_9TREE|nr:uncharacterized protein CC85DRAFT_288161 [Cutaneotrichosporon oleaginosum]KLT39820.1 hypothetical protein CC85DRAFT_288161 [Cutaneotrichosporon oleaginosum]
MFRGTIQRCPDLDTANTAWTADVPPRSTGSVPSQISAASRVHPFVILIGWLVQRARLARHLASADTETTVTKPPCVHRLDRSPLAPSARVRAREAPSDPAHPALDVKTFSRTFLHRHQLPPGASDSPSSFLRPAGSSWYLRPLPLTLPISPARSHRARSESKLGGVLVNWWLCSHSTSSLIA